MGIGTYIKTIFFILFPSSYRLISRNIRGRIKPFVIINDLHKAKVGQGTVIREFTFVKGNVEIGKDCLISHFIILDAGYGSSIKIGNNTAIGGGAKFWCEPSYYKPGPPNISRQIGDIVVGDRVIIGSNVTVLNGVTIGDDAVIGANAVVVNDIPPRSIAVGVPAKVIKKIQKN